MKLKKRAWLLMGLAVVQGFLLAEFMAGAAPSSSPSSSTRSEIEVPCRQSSKDLAFLRSCQDVIQGKQGNAANATDKIPGMIDQLKGQVRTDIEQIYGYQKGVDGEYSQRAPQGPGIYDYSDPDNLRVYHVEPRTCSLLGNLFNGNKPEIHKNHHGESCGSPACVKVDVKIERILGVCVGADVSRSIWLQETGDQNFCPAHDKGLLEHAYYQGAMIQSFDFHLRQVLSSITQSKKITVGKGCGTLAKKYKKLSAITGNGASSQAVQGLRKLIANRANISDIVNCENTSATPSTVDQGMDVGSLRQSAQQLCAARAALETTFLQLARCEVAARSVAAFKLRFGTWEEFDTDLKSEDGGGPEGSECTDVCDPDDDKPAECQAKLNTCVQNAIKNNNRVTQSPADLCNQEVENSCRSCDNATECSTRKANECYARVLPEYILERMQLWR